MQSTHYDMLNPSLLARIRAQCGAPVLPGADQSESVDGLGTYFRTQPGLTADYVYGAILQLHAQITAAGYDASSVVLEGEPFSYELNWQVPAGPAFEESVGVVLASIGQGPEGWSLHVDTLIGSETQDTMTLEAVALDDSTLLRWLGLWLDVGLSFHTYLAKPASEPADDAAPADAASDAAAA